MLYPKPQPECEWMDYRNVGVSGDADGDGIPLRMNERTFLIDCIICTSNSKEKMKRKYIYMYCKYNHENEN